MAPIVSHHDGAEFSRMLEFGAYGMLHPYDTAHKHMISITKKPGMGRALQ